ncbi:Membrane protein putative [Halorhabdus tiamatea SARL4B]|uniref:Membrane protein putative n=1 Tax=Halorhabdus tiamatea SARL4B TaxID=1033806 RepID=F7PN57_9EURY|nr:thioredoxin domain-containing protein [Halorhabdus tiamatea]ERJ07732.1 Membrane protein putative [Halorhabdus tiamatea SARL4B]CCQ32610.1 thioredoxin domain protein [Halorhabdus tiamatea SARL4B]
MPDDNAARSTRRAFIGGLAIAGTAGLAGCSALSGDDDGIPTITVDPETETLPTPVRGDPDADVTVAAFEDYACGHCATYVLEHLPSIVNDYVEPGVIRYEHYDFPLPLSQESLRAPSAARAVQDTVGLDAYWEFSHALFENQGRLGLSLYEELASEVGADPAVVRAAAEERRYDPTVAESRQYGLQRGVEATPTVIVNGTVLDSYAADVIAQAIEAER